MGVTGNLKIGDVAKRASVSIQAIRYYERLGILKPTARRESGYRLYDDSAVHVLHFIRQAQELGFSLDEIRDLLALRSVKTSRCESVRTRASRHLEDVERKIAHLEKMRTTLRELIKRCQRRGTDLHCPILDAFESEGSR